ncbi:MAG: hypothetical protein FJY88_00235 [Candidatus Eisenbacteria bacterium]|nr:hypothetical protein [Candidatus Eisenbacteria bacterium]
MKNWYRQSFTLVNPEQVAAMKYRGCATPRAVMNFCARHNVSRVWWKPQDSPKRILMVDLYNFWNCWYEAYGQNQYQARQRQWRKPQRAGQAPRPMQGARAMRSRPQNEKRVYASTRVRPKYRKAA